MIVVRKSVNQENKLAILEGSEESATVDGNHVGVSYTDVWSEIRIMRQNSAMQKLYSVELNKLELCQVMFWSLELQ